MIDINRDKCMYCGACVGTCPVNCMFLYETRVEVDESKCIKCGFCERVCPVGAITLLKEDKA